MEDLKILVTKQQKSSRDPYCYCPKPRDPMMCAYCGKHDHVENICYTKQRDEQNKARVQDKRDVPIQVLKKDKPKTEEERSTVMYIDGNRGCVH